MRKGNENDYNTIEYLGECINRDVLGNQRAEYGKQIVAQLARQLQEEYGKKGFDEMDALDLPFKWWYIPLDYPQPELYM